jgi:hypothetical protein
MTPRNTDAIGSQPCESMVCKFPPTQSEYAGLGEHNQCLLELRLLDHWQRICGHQRVLRSLGRSSGSCLGENLCGVAPSKRHFLREMAGEAYCSVSTPTHHISRRPGLRQFFLEADESSRG